MIPSISISMEYKRQAGQESTRGPFIMRRLHPGHIRLLGNITKIPVFLYDSIKSVSMRFMLLLSPDLSLLLRIQQPDSMFLQRDSLHT